MEIEDRLEQESQSQDACLERRGISIKQVTTVRTHEHGQPVIIDGILGVRKRTVPM